VTLQALLDGLEIPIIQAPMLGASDAALAIAVSRAGGMGSLAAGALAPPEIGPAVAQVRAATDRPFGVNLLMAPKPQADAETLQEAIHRLAPWYAGLGEPLPEIPNQFAPDFEAQLDALITAAPPVASFTFDVLRREQVDALHRASVLVVGTANTVAEARAWAEVGADGICAQGAEAGGHHGYFLADIEDSVVGTLPLTATVRAAVDLPVIAAGGIMDGRGVAAALALGAAAAQIGTGFLLADEAVTSKPWRDAIAAAPDDPTRLTRAFTGRYARGVENRFMREMRQAEGEAPAYPVQNRLTQPLREAARIASQPDLMSLWAGQGVKLARTGSAEGILRWMWAEVQDAARALGRRASV
jgi:nitronate monooxygenase